LKSNKYETQDTSISFKGPENIIVQEINLPPSVEIVDNRQHIANVIEPVHLCIELKIERNHGYHIKALKNFSRRKLLYRC